MNADIKSENVGQVFIDQYGHVWKLISYQSEPMATLERIHDGFRMIEPISCGAFDDKTLLVPSAVAD